MKRCFATLGLFLALVTLAQGQDVVVVPIDSTSIAGAPSSGAESVVYQEGGETGATITGRFRAFWNKLGYCCAGDHRWFGCGNWQSQNTFVFGSCRTFFGEPCFPKESQPRQGILGAASGNGCASCGR